MSLVALVFVAATVGCGGSNDADSGDRAATEASMSTTSMVHTEGKDRTSTAPTFPPQPVMVVGRPSPEISRILLVEADGRIEELAPDDAILLAQWSPDHTTLAYVVDGQLVLTPSDGMRRVVGPGRGWVGAWPDADRLVLVVNGSDAEEVNLATGVRRSLPALGALAAQYRAETSPLLDRKGEYAVFRTVDGRWIIGSRITGQAATVSGTPGSLTFVRISPDGQLVATVAPATSDRSRVCVERPFAQEPPACTELKGRVADLAFSPDSRWLAMAFISTESDGPPVRYPTLAAMTIDGDGFRQIADLGYSVITITWG